MNPFASFFTKLVSPITNLLDSFKIDKGGFSGRKLTASLSFVTAAYVAVVQLPANYKIDAVYAFLCLSGVCLGLVTIPQIIEFLSGKKSSVIETTKTETTNEKTVQ